MVDEIELSIPARADLVQLVRMTAGVVAARAGLGLDDVEDLRLGVEELCLPFVTSTGDSPPRLALRFGWDDETIEITCRLVTDPSVKQEAQATARDEGKDQTVARELSSQILDALVDEHGVTVDGSGQGAWLRMRRRRPDA